MSCGSCGGGQVHPAKLIRSPQAQKVRALQRAKTTMLKPTKVRSARPIMSKAAQRLNKHRA